MALSKLTSNSFSSTTNTSIDNGTFTVDVTNNRVGINTTSPVYPLDVTNPSGDPQIRATGTASGTSGQFIANGIGSGSYPGFSLYQDGTNYWTLQQRGDTNCYLYRQSGSGSVILNAPLRNSAQPAVIVSNQQTGSGNLTGGTVYLDVTSSYNGTNGRFTAPVTGLYAAGITVYVEGSAMCEIGLYKNGSGSAWFFQKNYTGNNYEGFGGAQLVYLTAGDYINWYNNKGTIRGSGEDHRWIYLVG